MTSNDAPTPPPARRRVLGRGPGAAPPPRTTEDPDPTTASGAREPVTRLLHGPDAETGAGDTEAGGGREQADSSAPLEQTGGPDTGVGTAGPRTAPAVPGGRSEEPRPAAAETPPGPHPRTTVPLAAAGVAETVVRRAAAEPGRDAGDAARERAAARTAAVTAPSAPAGPGAATGGVAAIGSVVADPGPRNGPETRAVVAEPEPEPEPERGAAAAGGSSSGAAVGTRPPGGPREDVPAARGDSSGGGTDPGTGDGAAGFKVRLANFEGPFDLLLQLISKHKLDVTEVALSKVTDEFMAYIRARGADWDLDETTGFLVVAATLLDLKAARLLPAAEVEDEADLALLEARDLLFARLLQYRAYKQIAEIFNRRLDDEARRYPRTVGLEPQHAELLPDVVISIGPERFARLAVKAMQPRPRPQVYVDHIHAPLVSVQEQAGIVVARLRELGEASFRTLVEDTDDTLTVVARFLALLELYREKAVALDQEAALGELIVRWTGGEGQETPTVTDEFDRPPREPEDESGKPPRSQEETA